DLFFVFFFQAEDGIRDRNVTGVQTCALPISAIFECATRSKDLAGSILNVGDPNGIALADFLQLIAKHRLGRERMALHIPLWPIRSEERRVGKECRSRWSEEHGKKKTERRHEW